MNPRVIFLGGNGHAAVRLERAQALLREKGEPFELEQVGYPGFEGRAAAPNGFEGFLRIVAEEIERLRDGAKGPVSIHATGIGATIFLALRSRGQFVDLPAVLEGAVLWGLEERRFPKLMRTATWVPRLLQRALRTGLAKRRFRRKYMPGENGDEYARRFFEGYEQCKSFADFFTWLDPAFLRTLEKRFAENPERLEGIEFWVGEHDAVVGLREVRLTESALGRTFPVRELAGFGHYPLLEQPGEWLREVERSLER